MVTRRARLAAAATRQMYLGADGCNSNLALYHTRLSRADLELVLDLELELVLELEPALALVLVLVLLVLVLVLVLLRLRALALDQALVQALDLILVHGHPWTLVQVMNTRRWRGPKKHHQAASGVPLKMQVARRQLLVFPTMVMAAVMNANLVTCGMMTRLQQLRFRQRC